MRARRGLISSRFLVLLLPLILVSCSGGGSNAPPSSSVTPGPPPALIYSVGDVNNSTPNQLVRSQTDGSAHITLADATKLDTYKLHIFLSGSTMVYQIFTPPDFGSSDIWQVQTDGTGTRGVVMTTDGVRDVVGPWVVYGVNDVGGVSSTTSGVQLDGTGQHVITDEPAAYLFHVGDRLVFLRIADQTLFSVLLDGTDRHVLTTLPPDSTVSGALGSQVVFSSYNATSGSQQIFAVPITGGTVTTLAAGSDYNSIAALVGARLVYQRCPLIGTSTIAGPCDVYSVLSDGSGTVALGTQPASEAVHPGSEWDPGDYSACRRGHGQPV